MFKICMNHKRKIPPFIFLSWSQQIYYGAVYETQIRKFDTKICVFVLDLSEFGPLKGFNFQRTKDTNLYVETPVELDCLFISTDV